jgi:protease-4
MARKRDIVIAVIIGVSFVGAMGLMALMFIGLMGSDGDFDLTGRGGNIGVIEMFGVINEQSGREVVEQIDKWAYKNSIKAIVIHINSPGGGVAISQEIYDAILRARQEKPVVAAMAGVAASGGLYIACAADRVIANPGTLTGSIGVIFQFHTAEELMNKVGLRVETVKSGELKDVGSYARAMTEKEELMLRSVVMDSYEQFIEVVAIGRNMDVQDVRDLADGAIYTGHQAYNYGLVDSLGGLSEAVDIAGELAGLEGDLDIVRPYEGRDIGLFDLLGSVLAGVDQRLHSPLGGPQLLYLYQ